MSGLQIKNLTRRPLPRFAYTTIARTVLPDWDVSLVFVGPTKARELNIQLRGKSYTPNVLSYVVGEKSGEIFICLAEANMQASAHDMSEREFVLYLFIHGVLHLKGWAHGSIMEECEQKLLAQFGSRTERTTTHGTTHSHRHRHRDVPGKDGRRRRVR